MAGNSMRPAAEDDVIRIPHNIGLKGGIFRNINLMRLVLVALGYVFAISFGVFLLIALSGFARVIWFLIPIVLYDLCVRYVIVHEKYYIERFKDLEAREYKLDYSVLWNINNIIQHPGGATVFSYASGYKGVYVIFEHGATVGKLYEDKYDNDECVGNMYRAAMAEGVNLQHFDYMDVVGKDERIDFLFEKLENCQNKDVQGVMGDVYSNVSNVMNAIYTNYDVYLFYAKCESGELLDKVTRVLKELSGSYYKGVYILSKDDIPVILHNMYPLNEFSINDAIETVVNRESNTNYIRVLELEKDGEVQKISKSSKELAIEAKQGRREKSIKVRKSRRGKDTIKL